MWIFRVHRPRFPISYEAEPIRKRIDDLRKAWSAHLAGGIMFSFWRRQQPTSPGSTPLLPAAGGGESGAGVEPAAPVIHMPPPGEGPELPGAALDAPPEDVILVHPTTGAPLLVAGPGAVAAVPPPPEVEAPDALADAPAAAVGDLDAPVAQAVVALLALLRDYLPPTLDGR